MRRVAVVIAAVLLFHFAATVRFSGVSSKPDRHPTLSKQDQSKDASIGRNQRGKALGNGRRFASNCIRFFTFATASTPEFCTLLLTAQVAGIDVRVLAYGANFTGVNMKIEYMERVASNLDPDCVIVFADGYDTFHTLTNEQEVLSRYRKVVKNTAKKLLFNAEQMDIGCMSLADIYHDNELSAAFYDSCFEGYPPPPAGKKRHALNTGCFIGTASLVSRFFRKVNQFLSNFTKSHPTLTPEHEKKMRKYGDQMAIQDLYRVEQVREEFALDLDWNKHFFGIVGAQGTTDYPSRDVERGRWKSKSGKGEPAIMHSPGTTYATFWRYFSSWKVWYITNGMKEKRGDLSSFNSSILINEDRRVPYKTLCP